MNMIYELNTIANNYESLGKYKKALKIYNKALKLDPTNPDIHHNKALLLLKMSKYKKGWEEFEKYRWQSSIKKIFNQQIHICKLKK